jgi:pyrroloquinoline-quinone synthase
MDRTTFRTEIKRIVSDNELSKHPYVELVSQGRASREQLKGYPLQHYEMTVRDSAPLAALLYLRVRELDEAAGAQIAQSFAEEALGLYSHTASHTDLLFELWEGGLGLERKQLVDSIGSEESRGFSACLYRLLCLKPHFLGAFGLMEEMEVQAYLKLMNGMRQHYGIQPEHLRFFAVHYEADKDHSEAGHELIERFVSGSGREEEFLAEARGLAHFFWKGFDSMLAA